MYTLAVFEPMKASPDTVTQPPRVPAWHQTSATGAEKSALRPTTTGHRA